MPENDNISILDQRQILQFVFPLVYASLDPYDYFETADVNAPNIWIEVEEDVKVGCGLWAKEKEWPTVLYFHGNGETVADYAWIAPFYLERGVNLLVADYRGYGGSGGKPTFANMLSDSHLVFEQTTEMLRRAGFAGSLFVMGRSLGSLPAIEVAAGHHTELKGLIIESGSAHNFRHRWSHLIPGREEVLGDEGTFLNKVKIRRVTMPTLIIHGEYDDLIPYSEGATLYENSGAEDKRMVTIPRAGHNDIMMMDEELYFGGIADFVKAHG